MTREADKVREALHDDPFVTDAEYGRLVEEAAEADERASWAAECPEVEELHEGPIGIAAHKSMRFR